MSEAHRILLVEDDDLLRETVQEILVFSGYKVAVARDGAEACAQLHHPLPDLVITDLRMPTMDGFALLAEVRKRFPWHEMAVIILSAKAEQRDIRQGIAMGADDYVVKPFAPDDLLKTVSLRLERLTELRAIHTERERFFLSTVPHELRTPLCGVIGCSELMLATADSGAGLSLEDTREFGELIFKSGERLLALIEKFTLMNDLHLMRTAAPESRDGWQSNGWEQRLTQKTKQLAAYYGRTEDLQMELAGYEPKVPGEILVRVVAALVDNAFKFSLPGKQVRLRTAKETPEICLIEVADFGSGFATERLKDIRPFRQFERGRMEQQGAGTGLSCTMALARIAGGNFTVAPKADGTSGTVFQLRLPLQSAPQPLETFPRETVVSEGS